MPEKMNVFIEYLAELYGSDPYWDKGLDLANLPQHSSGADGKAAKVLKSSGGRAHESLGKPGRSASGAR